jgi:hypothetical protein
MGPGPTTPLEIVRAVVVGKCAVLVAVALAVVMIWKRRVGTGRVGALKALRTAWCSISRKTRARLGNAPAMKSLADVQGRGRPSATERAVGEMETTGVGRVGIAIVTVTVTVTELTGIEGAKAHCCTYPVQTINIYLRMPDGLQHCAPNT